MKKLLALLVFTALLFTGCEGDPGPPGPPGQDGLDGLIGTVFEYEITFNDLNDPSVLVDFPAGVEVFDTDVVLAYVLDGVEDGFDVWEPLPQTIFFPDGSILLTAYNHTFVDIEFFLDGTTDLFSLDPVFTDNLIFRVAVIPADLLGEIDATDMEQVMNVANKIDRQPIIIE